MNFTAKHDKIIVKAISKKPYNLQEAFRDAAYKIGICLPIMVERRYYKVLRHNTTIFIVKSDNHYSINTKKYTTGNNLNIINDKQLKIQFMIPNDLSLSF